MFWKRLPEEVKYKFKQEDRIYTKDEEKWY